MTSPLNSLYALLTADPFPGTAEARRYVRAFLTAHPTPRIPVDAWPLLDRLWQQESTYKKTTDARDLPLLPLPGMTRSRFSLWRGDITHLAAGAIVNAANSGLTGCYQPFHACVDNAIHTAAGPWLRQSCEKIMAERRRPEPTGTATVTHGFYLPSKYVIHTVGPIVPDHVPVPLQEKQLVDCYRNSISAAVEVNAESIAFCSISTGVFGYPKLAAAKLSLQAITETLNSLRGRAPHVVVVAYTQADEAVYRNVLKALERSEQ